MRVISPPNPLNLHEQVKAKIPGKCLYFSKYVKGDFSLFHGFGRSPVGNRSTAFSKQRSVHGGTGNGFHSHKCCSKLEVIDVLFVIFLYFFFSSLFTFYSKYICIISSFNIGKGHFGGKKVHSHGCHSNNTTDPFTQFIRKPKALGFSIF